MPRDEFPDVECVDDARANSRCMQNPGGGIIIVVRSTFDVNREHHAATVVGVTDLSVRLLYVGKERYVSQKVV